MTLTELVPDEPTPDTIYEAFAAWALERGLVLYPHQEEALIEVVSGANVILSTPTGSGKSLVAAGAHFAALAEGRRTFYTAPIKALVSEKFFALCDMFGAANVGMLTGDASVNPEAPIICCTAEILANIALRDGERADVGQVVMDEFHFYAEPDRGWAWQVPLIELPQAQFVLMSATLGDVTELAADISRRNGRETALVTDAERPVPLTFTWALTPLPETLEELVLTHQAPVYVVHFTQKDAVEHATALLNAKLGIVVADELKDRLAGFRFGAGFGKTLAKLLRKGIGVHHAGLLPRYRRLVEQLAQAGLLTVICGTDTLGVGINVPIRTVLFTGLAKYDGNRSRVLRIREFHQIAGRAGRAGFDTAGYVVVQAPEHTIENEKAKAKADAKNAAMSVEKQAKRKSKAQLRKPPEGTVVWTEQTFDRLVTGVPEQLVSRMRVDNSMLINVLGREEDAFPVLRRILTDNHETERDKLRLSRRALRLARSLLQSGTLTRLDEVDEFGRRYVLTVDLPEDFALNQELAHFALAALDVLDPEAEEHTLEIVSVIEAVLEGPRQILFAQQHAARGEAINEMKADGIEYEERMERLQDVSYVKPLEELLFHAYGVYRKSHPWVGDHTLSPKSVVRDMYERAMTFSEFVSYYELARTEGIVLRYLAGAYKALEHTVPDDLKSEDLQDLIAWLGELVRQVDSSLLDEWEQLANPEVMTAEEAQERADQVKPVTSNARAFRVLVRNAMFRRVELAALDRFQELAEMEESGTGSRWDADAWAEAMDAYWDEYDDLGTGPDARGPKLLQIEEQPANRLWRVRQVFADPNDDHGWGISAEVDLDASDEEGRAVVRVTDVGEL
jgi:superfamily II RNA helicase